MITRSTCLRCLCFVFWGFAGAALPIVATAQPVARAEGTSFAIQGDGYEITVASSQFVRVSMMTTGHDELILVVEGTEGVSFAQVTVGGLTPSATIYRYLDGLQNRAEIITDAQGAMSVELDLSQPRLIQIKPYPSTILLTDLGWRDSSGNDPMIGDWDPVTRTATLDSDVADVIAVYVSNATLDGGEFTVSELQVYGSSLEIMNLRVDAAPHVALLMFNVQSITLHDNVFSGRQSAFMIACFSCDIYNNSFYDEFGPPLIVNNPGTSFSRPAPVGGNYWDYAVASGTLVDGNGDGFSDAPLAISFDAVDELPFMTSFGWLSEPPNGGGNQAPMANAGSDQPAVECAGPDGTAVSLDGSGSSDSDGDPLTYSWALPGGATATGATPTVVLPLGTHTITLTVDDGNGGTASDEVVVTVVDTTAPSVGAIVAPTDPVAVGTTVDMSAGFTDLCDCGGFTAAWEWGDGTTCVADGSDAGCAVDQAGHVATGTHSYATAGVYTVTLTVTDCAGNVSDVQTSPYVVVYDPSAGFVTGGGWIDSPAGAYRDDPTLTGTASFGFVSKYKKGQTTPDGQTQFSFHAAGLDFHSTDYQWLVIAGHNAKYKGSGELDGAGGYGFMLTAVDGESVGDGEPDRFWIRIWETDDEANPVYDNQPGASEDAEASQPIGGGSIVIHSGGGGGGRTVAAKDGTPPAVQECDLGQNTPNPFNPTTRIAFALPEARRVRLAVYAVDGRHVATLVDGFVPQGTHEVFWAGQDEQGRRVGSGVYFYRLDAGTFSQTKRMMLVK